jgi:hypothetical protein
MTTYGTMQARIANEIARPDLTDEIKTAIKSAIDTYAPERFWFNTVRNVTFTTVSGQRAYGATANAAIPTMAKIDHLLQTQDSSLFELIRMDELELELLQSPTSTDNKPTHWAWVGDEIHFWPTPNGAYSTRLIGVSRLSTLSADGDTNAWMTYGERLIRGAAKRIIGMDLIQDGDLANTGAATEQLALESLLRETEMRMPRDVIQATCF